MIHKQKKCKGTGKAISYGCGTLAYKRTYGLCCNCYRDWLLNSYEGNKKLEVVQIRAKKKAKPVRKYVKWHEKEMKDMLKYVQDNIVNKYIRTRDNICYARCISSNNQIVDAGHFYSVGAEARLRFCIQNIHGQNWADNRFMGGNNLAYERGLINRFGQKYLDELKLLRALSVEWPKLDKIELIKIGVTYEHLYKKQIWCFRHIEFENYKSIIAK